METRKIPDTDLEVSRLALGCMGLGGGWVADTKLTTDHERQAREFLDAAEEIGANFFDHAISTAAAGPKRFSAGC